MKFLEEARKKMNKTLLVIIDGLTSAAIEKATTPTLDYLIQKGAFTPGVKTVTPPITLPSHFSIFTSLAPYSHGVLTNTALPNMSAAAQSLFGHVKSNGGTVSSFYSWEHLRNLSLPGTMDHSFFLRLRQKQDLIELAGIAACHILHQTPDFCFVYFEWTDIIGHCFGWMSPEYLEAVKMVDRALGLIVEGIVREDNYHLIVTSDHGGKGKNHLENFPEITRVPLIAFGPDIRENFRIEKEVSLLDIAPTIAALLNIPPHFAWEGKGLAQMMEKKPYLGDLRQAS